MTGKKHYVVLKTYYCNILESPCVQIEEGRYRDSPPNCDLCEIAQKPEPPETGELYDVVTIVPGKGVFGKKLAAVQDVEA